MPSFRHRERVFSILCNIPSFFLFLWHQSSMIICTMRALLFIIHVKSARCASTAYEIFQLSLCTHSINAGRTKRIETSMDVQAVRVNCNNSSTAAANGVWSFAWVENSNQSHQYRFTWTRQKKLISDKQVFRWKILNFFFSLSTFRYFLCVLCYLSSKRPCQIVNGWQKIFCKWNLILTKSYERFWRRANACSLIWSECGRGGQHAMHSNQAISSDELTFWPFSDECIRPDCTQKYEEYEEKIYRTRTHTNYGNFHSISFGQTISPYRIYPGAVNGTLCGRVLQRLCHLPTQLLTVANGIDRPSTSNGKTANKLWQLIFLFNEESSQFFGTLCVCVYVCRGCGGTKSRVGGTLEDNTDTRSKHRVKFLYRYVNSKGKTDTVSDMNRTT